MLATDAALVVDLVRRHGELKAALSKLNNFLVVVARVEPSGSLIDVPESVLVREAVRAVWERRLTDIEKQVSALGAYIPENGP